jgi:anti-sigma regulatory factor (Ser/Thr protein kinase)
LAIDVFLVLPRNASAVTVARHAAERHAGGQLPDRHVADLKLIVSELVTNAVVHGSGAIRLRLHLEAGIVRGEVMDEGGGFEAQVRGRGAEEFGGRGLMIVEALTTRWGIHEGTTHVWFEVDLENRNTGIAEPKLGQSERPDALGTP